MTATATVRPRPRPNPALWLGLVGTLAVTVWAAAGIEFTLRPLFEDLTAGAEVLQPFFHPDWDYLANDRVIAAWWQTLSIAILASLFGCGLALLVALLASQVTTPNRPVYWFTRQLLSVVRALPDVAYGLLFVLAVGIGPLAGILALTFFNLGICAKLTAETVDAVEQGPIEAADAAGADRLQRVRVAVLPQILPSYVSYCLYVFELNVRASVIIGLVGGGGIGAIISFQLHRSAWGGFEKVAAILAALFVVVLVLDQVSRALRRRLL